MKKIILDFEVFPNWWCMSYSEPNNFEKINTVTCETPNVAHLLSELRYGNVLITFNGKFYDNKIYHAIVQDVSPQGLYKLSKSIITGEKHYLNNYRYWNKYNWFDLYPDWLFGSLKAFESNYGLSIKESSVPFDKEHLTEEDKLELIRYCEHDVKATIELFKFRETYFNSKLTIAKLFNLKENEALRLTNANLSARALNALKQPQTNPDTFILPERVKDYVNSNLPKEVVSLFNIINEERKVVNLFDNKIIFGVGGIHSTNSENIKVFSSDVYKLINIDVTSYYPNLMMVYDYLSRNVPDPSIYRFIYEKRLQLKKEMKVEYNKNGESDLYQRLDREQNAFKLILNTTYGAMKNEYNALYDPYQASNVCYLGQILLATLANELYTKLGLIVVQTNTDGILVKIKVEDIPKMQEIVKNWETVTGLNMEYDHVKEFYQRDVNNYIEMQEDGKLKLKGKWSNQAKRGTSMSNLNAVITHKAILNYYTKGTPLRETIYSCDNVMEFVFTTKMGRTYDKCVYFENDVPIETTKVNRVVATIDKTKGTLKKVKLEENRYDKIAEIPDHCLLLNEKPTTIPAELDREWYVQFAENKLVELKEI